MNREVSNEQRSSVSAVNDQCEYRLTLLSMKWLNYTFGWVATLLVL